MAPAYSYNNIGVVLKDKGDLDGALGQLQRALAIREVKAPNSLTVSTSYNNISSVLKEKGDLDGARNTWGLSHAFLTSGKFSIVAWHPSLIYCKYQLGLLLLTKDLFKEVLPFANYTIQHLPKYKFAYHLKARALVGLKKLEEALNIYDHVIILAPNYGDAHIGRLNVIFKLAQEREDERPAWVKRFLEAYESALEVDVKLVDKVDDDVHELFEAEKRARDDLQVVALPISGMVDQAALLQQLCVILNEFKSDFKKLYAKNDELQSKNDELQSKMKKMGDGLQSRMEKLDVKADKILDNQIEYSYKMTELYQQLEAVREMAAAYRAEHVQDDCNVLAILERIEEIFVSDGVERSEMLTLLQYNRKLHHVSH